MVMICVIVRVLLGKVVMGEVMGVGIGVVEAVIMSEVDGFSGSECIGGGCSTSECSKGYLGVCVVMKVIVGEVDNYVW